MNSFKKKYLSFEFNEVNIEWLDYYVNKYNFKNLRLLFKNNFLKTSSEKKYEELEPWIQWPSFYYGKSLSQHKIFHLGDCHHNENLSIYDFFQKENLSVLAVSPMNCTFDVKNQSLLIHDPWSSFNVMGGDKFIDKLWLSIRYFVNENSNNSLKISYLFTLLIGIAKFARLKNTLYYFKFIFLSFFFKWSRAILLDLLVFDIFYFYKDKRNFHYSSVFLNAGAHIQHHYFFDSKYYKENHGKSLNPKSYSSLATKKLDPIFQIYKLYDHLSKDINDLNKNNNILVTSGLQQKENLSPYYQYRLRDYVKFLNTFKIKYKAIEKKMSRDSYIYFNNKDEYLFAITSLKKFLINGNSLFKIKENKKEHAIFLQVAYRGEINEFSNVFYDDKPLNLLKSISLVSIENTIHRSDGWHLNNFFKFNESSCNIKDLTKSIFGFDFVK